MSLTPKELNDKEIEILRTLPESEVPDFIEKCGGRMRSILEQEDQEHIEEDIENLKKGYRGI